MRRVLLKSKIHRACVTGVDLHYEGSITLDAELMREADIVEHEQVQVYNITNGNRLTTYAMPGEAGSRRVCLNGAAAHLVEPGDRIIVASYAEFGEDEVRKHKPRIVLVDEENRLVERAACGTGTREPAG